MVPRQPCFFQSGANTSHETSFNHRELSKLSKRLIPASIGDPNSIAMDYYDVEKNPGSLNSPVSASEKTPHIVDEGNAVLGETFEYGNSTYAKLQRLAGKFKIEQRGIERVPESERTDDGFRALLNVSTMVPITSISQQ